jgi:hypothetical protein
LASRLLETIALLLALSLGLRADIAPGCGSGYASGLPKTKKLGNRGREIGSRFQPELSVAIIVAIYDSPAAALSRLIRPDARQYAD